MAAFYVHRTRGSHESGDWREGWVGPIDSRYQAGREVAAWQASGWRAQQFEGTPQVLEAVRRWQNAANERHDRAVELHHVRAHERGGHQVAAHLRQRRRKGG
jgi:hypothetical protein